MARGQKKSCAPLFYWLPIFDGRTRWRWRVGLIGVCRDRSITRCWQRRPVAGCGRSTRSVGVRVPIRPRPEARRGRRGRVQEPARARPVTAAVTVQARWCWIIWRGIHFENVSKILVLTFQYRTLFSLTGHNTTTVYFGVLFVFTTFFSV